MSGIMTAGEFQKICDVPRETMERFICYSEILLKWQKSINLVSNASLADMWRRHFYDSAQLMEHIGADKGRLTILDLGSGAGFPGLVLSILGAGQVHLVEAVGKKCSFMKQIIQKTAIDAIVHNVRIEDMDVFPVDLITSRACADLEKLINLTSTFRAEQTDCLFLKGEKAEEEIARAARSWNFKAEKFTSKSEEGGIILKLSQIKAC